MKNYKIKIKGNIDEYATINVTGIHEGLEKVCDGEIIDACDLTLFSVIMMSLVENIEIKSVSISKSEDEENYLWTIAYGEDAGIYKTEISLTRIEDDLNTSFIDCIQQRMRMYGLAEVLGVNYKYKLKQENNVTE